MKFYCQKFPFLYIKLGPGMYASFANGVFETDEPKVQELLRKHRWYGSAITEGKVVEWTKQILTNPSPEPVVEKKKKKKIVPVKGTKDEDLDLPHLLS